jgi:hypothetical protein
MNRSLSIILIISLSLLLSEIVARKKSENIEQESKDLYTKEKNEEKEKFDSENTLVDKPKQVKGSSFSKSEVFSYSYSNLEGKKKPENHIRKISTEEYVEKENDGPAKIRKYGEFLKKDNDDPAILKKRASTNIEKEGLVLGDGKEEKELTEDEFDVFFTIIFFFFNF